MRQNTPYRGKRNQKIMKVNEILSNGKITLSFEVFPPKTDAQFESVRQATIDVAALKPSYMSVTYGAGGSTKGNTIKLASEIQKQYQVPAMAHLTCVCATKESINTALTEMKQAGIENILALRGDIPKDYDGEVFTEFQHASQLVELIKKTGDFCVGGACYPEVHPDSKNKFDDINGLKEKVKQQKPQKITNMILFLLMSTASLQRYQIWI